MTEDDDTYLKQLVVSGVNKEGDSDTIPAFITGSSGCDHASVVDVSGDVHVLRCKTYLQFSYRSKVIVKRSYSCANLRSPCSST